MLPFEPTNHVLPALNLGRAKVQLSTPCVLLVLNVKLGTECLPVPGYYSWNAKGTCFCNSLKSFSIAFPESKSDFASRAMCQGIKSIFQQLTDRWVLFLKSIWAFLSARVYLMVYVTNTEIYLLHLFFPCCIKCSDFHPKYRSSSGAERKSKLTGK